LITTCTIISRIAAADSFPFTIANVHASPIKRDLCIRVVAEPLHTPAKVCFAFCSVGCALDRVHRLTQKFVPFVIIRTATSCCVWLTVVAVCRALASSLRWIDDVGKGSYLDRVNLKFSFGIRPLVICVRTINKVASDRSIKNNMKILVERLLPVVAVIRVDDSIKRLDVRNLVIERIHQLVWCPLESPFVKVCCIVAV